MLSRQSLSKLLVVNLMITVAFCWPIHVGWTLTQEGHTSEAAFIFVQREVEVTGGGDDNGKCCEVLISTHEPNGTCVRSVPGGPCDSSGHCDGVTIQGGSVVNAGTGCVGLTNAPSNCNSSKTAATPVTVPKGTLSCPGTDFNICDCAFVGMGTTTATITTCLHPDNDPCPTNSPIPVSMVSDETVFVEL